MTPEQISAVVRSQGFQGGIPDLVAKVTDIVRARREGERLAPEISLPDAAPTELPRSTGEGLAQTLKDVGLLGAMTGVSEDLVVLGERSLSYGRTLEAKG